MRFRLKQRYGLILLALTVSVVGLLGGALLFRFNHTIEEMRRSGDAVARAALVLEVEELGRAMAEHMAETLTNPLYRLELDTIHDLVRAANMQEGVRSAVVLDAEGRVLHDGTESLERYGELIGHDAVRKAIATRTVATDVGGDTIRIAAPIVLSADLLGAIWIDMSLERGKAQIAKLEATLDGIARRGEVDVFIAAGIVLAAVTLLSLALSLWIGEGLARPIRTLSEITSRIGRGDYNVDIPFARSDEIGELAGALKRMGDALRRTTVSKDYLDDILSSMLDPLLVFRMDGTVETANDAACRLFQVAKPDLLGKSIDEIMTRGGEGSAQFDLHEIAYRRLSTTEEGELYGAGGMRVPALISWSMIAEDAGRPRHVLCVARDITERKLAEQALKASEERVGSLIGHSPSAIFLVDRHGCLLLANQRFEDWYGLKAREIVGRNFHDVLPSELAAFCKGDGDSTADENAVVESELTLTLADGNDHSIATTRFPVRGSDGQVIGVGVVGTDVTELRRAEDQLRQSQKLEVIGQLTGGVAHDFNNLLAVIMGNAEMLEETLGADDPLAIAIMRAADRGADLTQRLLAFSRRQPLLPAVVDVGALVESMRDMLTRTLGEQIEIRIVEGPDDVLAIADPGQLENAILNLAVNARDAMPGGGELVIETSSVTLDSGDSGAGKALEPGDYVAISVRDNGCGIAPHVLDRVFEPFFTTKEVGKGSGLGLSMVYGFAKQSGGHIVIESRLEEGTTARLYLPRGQERSAAVAPKDAGEPPLGLGETVFVVEDDAAVRTLAVTLLESLGYAVVSAVDGPSAMAVMETTAHVDLLLSDMLLPGAMNGPDIAAAARERFPDIKVLFMSGYAIDVIRDSGHSIDGADILAKPFRKHLLAQRVRAALDYAAPRNSIAV